MYFYKAKKTKEKTSHLKISKLLEDNNISTSLTLY